VYVVELTFQVYESQAVADILVEVIPLMVRFKDTILSQPLLLVVVQVAELVEAVYVLPCHV